MNFSLMLYNIFLHMIFQKMPASFAGCILFFFFTARIKSLFHQIAWMRNFFSKAADCNPKFT